jgi:hypothetical protein
MLRLLASLLMLTQVCVAAPLPGTVDQSLGRLFTTRSERALIDRDRKGERRQPSVATIPDLAPPPPNVITGVVRRSDGRHTVWVDGTARPANDAQARREQIGKGVTP